MSIQDSVEVIINGTLGSQSGGGGGGGGGGVVPNFQPMQIGATPTAGQQASLIGFGPNMLITMTGAGTGKPNQYYTNINGYNPDQYNFFNVPFFGDVEFVCRFSTGALTARQQVGLAIREGFGVSDRDVAVFYSPAANNASAPGDSTPRSVVHQSTRLTTSTDPLVNTPTRVCPHIPNPDLAGFIWFKLQRIGGDIGAYWARDGINWMALGLFGVPEFVSGSIYRIGLFVASNSQSVAASTTVDNIYIGPLRLEFESSWVGNTYSRASSGTSRNLTDSWVSLNAQCMYVHPVSGVSYVGAQTDEAGQSCKAYKADGTIFRGLNDGTLITNGNHTKEGGITGDGTNVYIYSEEKNLSSVVGKYVRALVASTGSWTYDFTFTNTFGAGGCTGLACSSPATHELYASDLTGNRILVFDTVTHAELPGRAFSFTQGRPGPIAVDSRGDLWIIQEGVTSPMLHQYATTLTTSIRCYTKAGVDTGKVITSTAVPFPTHVHISPIADELWVCDGAVDSNIKIFTGLATTPVLNRTFGQTGGIWSGSNPGLVYDPAAGFHRRFYGLTSVGLDNAGNVYVACDGSGTDLRKFNTSGFLTWQLNADNDAFAVGDIDPTALDYMGRMKHYTLDLSKTAPGSEWAYKGYTHNPFRANTDPRTPTAGATLIRTLGGTRFMYFNDEGNFRIVIYRFVGETAIPCGSVKTVSGSPGTTTLWLDTNGDGIDTGGEETTHASPFNSSGGLSIMFFDVDELGDIWWNLGPGIMHLAYQGVGGAGQALYSLSGAGYEEIAWPTPFTFIGSAIARGIRYDQPNDAMYLCGNTQTITAPNGFSQFPNAGIVVARYDNWSTTKLTNPTPRYMTELPQTTPSIQTDDNMVVQRPYVNSGSPIYPFCKAFAAGEDYFMAVEEFAKIRVFDAKTGNHVYSINPGPEVNASMAFVDPIVFRIRKNGSEYLILSEASGYQAKQPLYRWTPQRLNLLNASPGTPTNMLAVGDNGGIRVTWQGAYGFIDSFNVYRTIAGVETLVANVNAPLYIDTSTTPGVSVSYRVRALWGTALGNFSGSATGTALAATATFVSRDNTHQGSWHGIYGAIGNYIIGDTNNLGSNIDFSTIVGTVQGVIASPSSNPIALENPGNTTRELNQLYNFTFTPSFSFLPPEIEIKIKDGSTKQLAMYFVCNGNSTVSQTVEIRDAVTNIIKDTRTLAAPYDQGSWMVYNVSGHLKIRCVNIGGNIANFNGFFIA